MTRECGFEYEVHGNGGQVAIELGQLGAIPSPPRLHDYHCSCNTCDYRNNDYLFAAQHDCSVSAEFVSKVLEFGTGRMDSAIKTITTASMKANADLTHDSGMHVHVSQAGLDFHGNQRLCRLFARYSRTLAHLAAGPREQVRAYNGPRPVWSGGGNLNGCGSWLSNHSDSTDTWEFRLWNATKMPWRIHLALGISVAMVNAAVDGVEVRPPGPKGRRFSTLLAPYWDSKTETAYWRQLEFRGHGKNQASVDNRPDDGGE